MTDRVKAPLRAPNDFVRTAETFLKGCIINGLAHSFDTDSCRWVKPYPEVTGYLLSYFAQEYVEAEIPVEVGRAAKKLMDIQHRSGGFRSFSRENRLFTFDTAQIMHGFATLHLATGKKCWLDAAVRAADFVCRMHLPNGSVFPVYDLCTDAKYVEPRGNWGICFSTIQVKSIEGLLLMKRLTDNARYSKVAELLCAFGRKNCDLTFTHPGAYCLEGLLAAGEYDFVRKKLTSKILPCIQPNGFIPYKSTMPYAYVSGSVQIGILLYKVGLFDESLRILRWARLVQQQHPSGGLFQYADVEGRLDTHVHKEINSWGTKFFCQLERLWQCGN